MLEQLEVYHCLVGVGLAKPFNKTGSIMDVEEVDCILQHLLVGVHIRSAKQDDIYGASNTVLPCPGK